MSTKTIAELTALRAAGASVGDLRKLQVPPADIRAAGYSVHDMARFLGPHLLLPVFSLAELRAVFSAAELLRFRSARDLIAAGFPLSDVAGSMNAASLRAAGISAADLVAAARSATSSTSTSTSPASSYWELSARGFTAEELEAAGMPTPPPVTPPPPLACVLLPGPPPSVEQLRALRVNADELILSGSGSAGACLSVTVRRVSAREVEQLLAGRSRCAPMHLSGYTYEGSGTRCPLCGHVLVLTSRYNSSDGMAGVERGSWVCATPDCGITKEESYEGYGTIFFSWKDL
jgi:hypothetical protein